MSTRNSRRVVPASRRKSAPRKKTASAKGIALQAARQALDEFATSPERLASLRTIIKEAVFDTLEKLGIDTQNPEATRKDMVHLRTWRELVDFLRKEGYGTGFKWIVTACFGALAVGVGVIFSRSTN